MKFGESLSEGLVPEWENQYVDYKTGKKVIKRFTLLQQEFERENIVDTTPLLEPIGEESPGPDYFFLNSNARNQELNRSHYFSLGLSHGTKNMNNQGQNLIQNQHTPSGDQPQTSKDDPSGSFGRRSSIFQFSSYKSRSLRKEDVAEEGAKFSAWIEEELTMVNNFFKDKERDVYHRFLILEDQFAQLKEHKTHMLRIAKSEAGSQSKKNTKGPVDKNISRARMAILRVIESLQKHELPSLPSTTFLRNFHSKKESLNDVALHSSSKKFEGFDPNYAENRIRNGESNVDSETEPESLSSEDNNASIYPASAQMSQSDSEQFRMSRKRDFATTNHFEVPYLYAKKVLKDALVEHYRSVALVRSYRTMNRTALRKITKKFDKASGSSICEDFMKRVDALYFQTSTVLDQISGRVEDLFLSFYGSENDTKKHGLEKLKSATYAMQPRLFHAATFVTGLFLGFAIPLLAIVIYIFIDQVVFHHNLSLKYLGEVWGGFILVNVAFILVGINYYTYTAYKINYKFIFEFNLANVLDYRQFLVLPSAGLAALGFCAWFSWRNFWPNSFPGRDWPLVFLCLALIGFLWPGRQLYAASRRWLQIALWRILWSGFYPVEFRDFYLGDILCSLTYSLSNLSYFICLYGIQWRHVLGGGRIPDTTKFCGSRYSRSMGFLAALPSIWRFLQCVRRYMDTGDLFPHLANMTKYLMGAMYYMFLSLWRINGGYSYRALFITFASINSTFTTSWDIFMDWSLLQPGSKNFLLRDELFYEKPIYYYMAMVIDVIFRFLWIIYVIFPGQLQQLAITSFCLAAAELFRRFVWMFFRMENEHRTNVTLFRASRESPLPYHLSRRVENAIEMLVEIRYREEEEPVKATETVKKPQSSANSRFKLHSFRTSTDRGDHSIASIDEEAQIRPSSATRRSTMVNISAAFNKAHIKDFQRRKYSVLGMDSDEEDGDDDLKSMKMTTSRVTK